MKYWNLAAVLATGAFADPIKRQAVSATATISVGVPQGTPQHLASGILYGIPDTANQIPSSFYTNMGFRNTRAGGSQLPAPARGWVYGTTEFQNRFNSALSNYKTARQYGAGFQILTADIWGADGTAQIAMPGDNGNWTSYDQFLAAMVSNIKSNSMTPGLDFEIWNEPDLTDVFWQRNQTQYLQMWGRGYHAIKKALPNTPIIGPCTSSQPSSSNTWLANFYEFVVANGSIPDIYCWHEETGGDDVQIDVAAQHALEAQYGLPNNPICINEYGLPEEQVPGCSAWYIARLERANVTGLRGNWDSSYSLHDYLASLLGKPGASTDENLSESTVTGYWQNGEYNIYQYYNLNMTGHRVQTISSPDNEFDIYATVDPTTKTVKMLCGSRLVSGTWDILVSGLNALGLPSSGTIVIQAYQFNWGSGQFADISAPVNQGTYGHSYSNNELVFYVSPNTTTGYAFEFTY